MREEEIVINLEKNYPIKINSLIKIKNVYKVYAEEGVFCLKVIKYEFPHFLFIISAMVHLQNRGFNRVPNFITCNNGEIFIKLGNNFGYLTPWVIARECNYDNPMDVKLASSKLAELHNASKGFIVTLEMKPRIGWLKWFSIFETRAKEIYEFRKNIFIKESLTEFDHIYLNMMKEQLDIASSAINHLRESEYLYKVKEEMKHRGFCHHDYAHHNILISSNNEVNIIDFDYCILDTHLHDLSSLMLRVMKNGRWDLEKVKNIFYSYGAIKTIYEEDIPIMEAFMEFPQDFWQVGLQYYYEKQDWGEEFFLKKLMKIKEDMYDKTEFLEEFRSMKYSEG